ncbi:hypothetical protein QYM36_013397 [Artemia franciscana]|uniref:Uncharacterized protein n=1 Tax=Artemia franciscana TaxID=6661 RepID=A0AA88KYR4_ARTSF|nr:hypothetical protein QYM36_013397 [Artemia franciscana]
MFQLFNLGVSRRSVWILSSDYLAGLFILYKKNNRKRTGNSRYREQTHKREEVKLLIYSPVPENMQIWQDNDLMKIQWAMHFIKYAVEHTISMGSTVSKTFVKIIKERIFHPIYLILMSAAATLPP